MCWYMANSLVGYEHLCTGGVLLLLLLLLLYFSGPYCSSTVVLCYRTRAAVYCTYLVLPVP